LIGPGEIGAVIVRKLRDAVDRADRITISHAGDIDPLVFEADINPLLAE
jgi:hypothetical protein